MAKLADTLIELWPQLRIRITAQDETSVTYQYDNDMVSYTLSVDECGRVHATVTASELGLSQRELSEVLTTSGSAAMMRYMAGMIQDKLW
jgi:hypothetical protein